jgi:hypothetical protein
MTLLKKLERSSQSMILVTLAMRERLSLFSKYELFLCLAYNHIRIIRNYYRYLQDIKSQIRLF